MTREIRTFHNVAIVPDETRVGPNGRPIILLQAIKPYVVDDYGSLWLPDTFDEGVTSRMAADKDDTPSLVWSHSWDDPIGHGIDYTPSGDGPRVAFELDDFDAVPRAKQADAQVRSKTMRDCSVGFSNAERRSPTDEERTKYPGIVEVIEKADLDEVSIVLRGAVPGAKVLAVRSIRAGKGMVDETLVIDLAKRVVAKELTIEEAKTAIDLAAVPKDEDEGGEGKEGEEPDPDKPDEEGEGGEGEGGKPKEGDEGADTQEALAELNAEVDAALELAS